MFFPLFVNIENKEVLIIGGGKIGGITGDTMGASLELTAILVLFAGIILK